MSRWWFELPFSKSWTAKALLLGGKNLKVPKNSFMVLFPKIERLWYLDQQNPERFHRANFESALILEPLFRLDAGEEQKNVYCDGIFDLCHIGHQNLFRNASKLGTHVFVGVVGDKDANSYKRPPIMTAAEREAQVLGSKYVDKVISNALCFGMTEEFLKEHDIHVCAVGQEYFDRYPNPDDDPYYKVPRKMGIAVPLPRFEGLSTSELIRRVRERFSPDWTPSRLSLPLGDSSGTTVADDYHTKESLSEFRKNVYCDGIFDLCHIGHQNLFRNASKLGTHVFVGVVGDKDANSYKRPPIMTAAEREAQVLGSKYVDKVISNALCFGMTEEFLKEHDIHVCAVGQEYFDRYANPDDDPYYKVPRKMGIAVPLPRFEGLSTSELIQRIQDRFPVDEPDKWVQKEREAGWKQTLYKIQRNVNGRTTCVESCWFANCSHQWRWVTGVSWEGSTVLWAEWYCNCPLLQTSHWLALWQQQLVGFVIWSVHIHHGHWMLNFSTWLLFLVQTWLLHPSKIIEQTKHWNDGGLLVDNFYMSALLTWNMLKNGGSSQP